MRKSLEPIFWRHKLRRPLRSTLFPYTTLFRSDQVDEQQPFAEDAGDDDREQRRQQVGSDAEIGEAGEVEQHEAREEHPDDEDRKSTRLNSSHPSISYAVFCLKKKKQLNHYLDA